MTKQKEDKLINKLLSSIIYGELSDIQAALRQLKRKGKMADERVYDSLYAAMTIGRLEAIEAFFDAGSDVNYTKNGSSLLMFVVATDNAEMAKILIRRNVKIGQVNKEGYNSLYLAVQDHSLSVVEVLLENGATLNARISPYYQGFIDKARNNLKLKSEKKVRKLSLRESEIIATQRCLIFAVRSNKLDTVKIVMARLIMMDQKPVYTNEIGISALSWAVLNKPSIGPINYHPEIAKILVNAGADVNYIDGNSNSLLISATQKDLFQMCQILLEAEDIDIDYRNKGGANVFDVASYYRRSRRYTDLFLSKKRRQLNEKLVNSAISGDCDLVNYFLTQPTIDINYATGKSGSTALKAAVVGGHVELVKLLLQKGADVNKEDYLGDTPLTVAAVMHGEEMLRVILDDKRCNINHTNKKGHTALYLSMTRVKKLDLSTDLDYVLKYMKAKVKFLLEKGAKVVNIPKSHTKFIKEARREIAQDKNKEERKKIEEKRQKVREKRAAKKIRMKEKKRLEQEQKAKLKAEEEELRVTEEHLKAKKEEEKRKITQAKKEAAQEARKKLAAEKKAAKKQRQREASIARKKAAAEEAEKKAQLKRQKKLEKQKRKELKEKEEEGQKKEIKVKEEEKRRKDEADKENLLQAAELRTDEEKQKNPYPLSVVNEFVRKSGILSKKEVQKIVLKGSYLYRNYIPDQIQPNDIDLEIVLPKLPKTKIEIAQKIAKLFVIDVDSEDFIESFKIYPRERRGMVMDRYNAQFKLQIKNSSLPLEITIRDSRYQNAPDQDWVANFDGLRMIYKDPEHSSKLSKLALCSDLQDRYGSLDNLLQSLKESRYEINPKHNRPDVKLKKYKEAGIEFQRTGVATGTELTDFSAKMISKQNEVNSGRLS